MSEVTEAPISDIQREAMRKLAEGFEKPDFNGRSHREVAESITRDIANAEEPSVRVEGVKILGSYANGRGYEWRFRPEVQAEIVNTITSIGEGDAEMSVKRAALEQIALRLEKPDFDGKIHGQAVEGIRKVASSVMVSAKESPEAPFVQEALGILGSYAKRGGYEWRFRPEVQSQARAAMNFITATAGVAQLEDLSSKK